MSEKSNITLRKRAIGMLLVFTGMCSSDIAALTFSDIDWVKEEINVYQHICVKVWIYPTQATRSITLSCSVIPSFSASRIKDHQDMRQLDMFDTTDYEKLEKVDATVDKIRRRYGTDSMMRAAFVRSPIDHMSGGISREKRTVDYKKVKID